MICRCVTLFTCLLLSLSAGFGTYALGAVTWCVIDPEGAGAKLLFTIPVALAGMTVPGIIGMLCCAFRCDFIPEPRLARVPATRPARAPASHRPTRVPRPTAAAMSPQVDEDLDLVLAT